MKLLVGKFKGKTLEEIPSWYVKYIAENWDERTVYDCELIVAADKEWKFREENNTHIEGKEEKPAEPRLTLDDKLSHDDVKQLAAMAIKYCAKQGRPKTAYNILAVLNEFGRLIK